MTRTLFNPPLDLLERRFKALRDQLGACRPELEGALQELSQAIAALRADREAGGSPGPDPPGGREAQEGPTAETHSPMSPEAWPGPCETTLHHIFSAIPDLFTVHDRDFNTIISNWHGYEPVPEAERQGRPKCYRVYHHRDRPCEPCHALEVLATGQPATLEKVNPVDGRAREIHAFPIKDESGRVVLVVEHVRDITDRHLAEQALKESEGRFRTLIEDSPESLFLTDVQGTILAASRVAAQRLGKSLAEVTGAIAFDLFPPEVAAHRWPFFDQAVATGRPVRLEDARGDRHFDINFNPILDADGKVSMMSILAIDITDRKNAEAALRESEERYRVLFEGSTHGILAVDMETGRFGYANPSICRMLGYSERELRQLGIADIHPKDSLNQVMVEFESLARNEKNLSAALPCRRKDGTVFYADIASAKSLIQGRRYAVGFFMDVSERRRAEEALRESEARFRAIFEYAPVGIVMADFRGRLLQANQAIYRITGYSATELRGMHFKEVTHPEDLPENLRLHQELVEGKRPHYFMEKRYLRKDGEIVWVNLMMSLLRDNQGEPHSFIATVVDITARKQAEAELRESEQRFRLMAETIQDVFWISTPEIDSMMYVSPAYEQVWGHTCQELYQSPQSFIDAIHPEDREQARSEIFTNQSRGLSYSQEYRIIRPDGAVRWVRDRGFPVRDDQGRVILVTGVVTDITESKALEAQLLQAQKMEAVGRLAGGVAHDFNNLLMAITGYGELMRDKVLQDDPLYGYLENILKAGDRAAALTQQLLTFSRQKIFHPQVIDLNRVVLDLEPMLRRLIGEDLHLEVVTDRRPVAVKADPGQLGQIIMNLVVNARDAMPQGGRLTLKAAPVLFKKSRHTRFGLAPPGPYVMLVVEDTGVGMDETIKTHAFEPFFTTKEPGKGTGLGLSTVYGIVKQSSGYLDLASEPGAGSTFTIYLPRLEGIVAPPKPRIPITASFRGEETVLLVEDEDVLRGLLAKFLRLYGYTVLEARHGGEALLLCERHPGPIHLMVTDVVMPQMSGRELADRLTPLRPEMKVIYMSGYTEDTLVQHGVANLSVVFLQKPFKPIELARRVYAVLHPPVSQ
jgi:two-component system cell cycle sensor histidine kinase/response regulator CckA